MNKYGKSDGNDKAVSFLHGYVTAKIEGLAEASSISRRVLATSLGELLLGSWTGPSNRVPELPGETARARKALAKVEMAKRSYRRKSPSAKKRIKPGPSKGKKLAWWYKLSDEEKMAVIAKRVASTKKTKEAI